MTEERSANIALNPLWTRGRCRKRPRIS